MFLVVVFIAASAVFGGIVSYSSKQAAIPQLQYRPGTPNEVVEICRQAVVATAKDHAAQQGAELLRVDAASAGVMRRVGRLHSAPVEVGIVYSRASGQETRQGVIECRVDNRGSAVLASLPGAEP
jgi:hypothetical protein